MLFLWGLISVPAAASGSILFAAGGWAAIDRGAQCEAATRALNPSLGKRPPALLRFTFAADRRRWGELSARLSRDVRPGSSVMLAVGAHRFLLTGQGGWAWSRGALQEQALMAAARSGGMLRIDGRDAGGRRFTDRYVLDGAATAIDAAAARCAGKIAGN
jgi:hypothetical protein